MKRRSLLAGAAASSLARPSLAGRSQTLTMIPQVALNSIDPVWTSSQIARNMGYMVFDQLYGRDEAMNAQAADGRSRPDGGWRPALDVAAAGKSVVARRREGAGAATAWPRCERWMKRNPAGGALEAQARCHRGHRRPQLRSAAEQALSASADAVVAVHHPAGDDAGTAGPRPIRSSRSPKRSAAGRSAGWRMSMCWPATPRSPASTATCRATNRPATPPAVIACCWTGWSGR